MLLKQHAIKAANRSGAQIVPGFTPATYFAAMAVSQMLPLRPETTMSAPVEWAESLVGVARPMMEDLSKSMIIDVTGALEMCRRLTNFRQVRGHDPIFVSIHIVQPLWKPATNIGVPEDDQWTGITYVWDYISKNSQAIQQLFYSTINNAGQVDRVFQKVVSDVYDGLADRYFQMPRHRLEALKEVMRSYIVDVFRNTMALWKGDMWTNRDNSEAVIAMLEYIANDRDVAIALTDIWFGVK